MLSQIPLSWAGKVWLEVAGGSLGLFSMSTLMDPALGFCCCTSALKLLNNSLPWLLLSHMSWLSVGPLQMCQKCHVDTFVCVCGPGMFASASVENKLSNMSQLAKTIGCFFCLGVGILHICKTHVIPLKQTWARLFCRTCSKI